MAPAVRPVLSRSELRQFLELPYALHADDPIWSFPLIDDFVRSLSPKNPLWRDGRGERELFIAWEGSRPVGRVMAHVHRASNQRHGERAGFFGFLECPEDGEVATALLDSAADWHRSRGLQTLRGPYEMTITQCIGAVVDGFDEPASFSQSWNAPHIPRLLEGLGFQVAYRAGTYVLDDVAVLDPDALLGPKQKALLADPAIVIRSFDLKRFEQDVRAATNLLNESFGRNFGFVPLSDPEIEFMAVPMKRVVRPELTVFVERAGEPVGVLMILPDFNVLFRRMNGRLFPTGWAKFLLGSKGLDRGVVQFMGTRSDLQGQGLMRVVLSQAIRAVQRAGIRSLECTWIGESNAGSLAQVKAVGMRKKHALQLYQRPL